MQNVLDDSTSNSLYENIQTLDINSHEIFP